MKQLSKFAQNHIQLCKGEPSQKIIMLWQIGRVPQSIITELAENFGTEDNMHAVANVLSRM